MFSIIQTLNVDRYQTVAMLELLEIRAN